MSFGGFLKNARVSKFGATLRNLKRKVVVRQVIGRIPKPNPGAPGAKLKRVKRLPGARLREKREMERILELLTTGFTISLS